MAVRLRELLAEGQEAGQSGDGAISGGATVNERRFSVSSVVIGTRSVGAGERDRTVDIQLGKLSFYH